VTWKKTPTPPSEPRVILKLLRERAPVYNQSAANTVASLTPELIRIEEQVLCRVCTAAELTDYTEKTGRLLSAFCQLGLETFALARTHPHDQLAQLLGSRVLEAVIGRSAKDDTGKIIHGMGAESGGPFLRQLPSHSKVIRRLAS
jgi:hypothetical protein